MWRPCDLAFATDRMVFLALFLATIIILRTEAGSLNRLNGNRERRQAAMWERAYAGVPNNGYGYSNPWNIGVTQYTNVGLPFLGPLTGGLFNGQIGTQTGYGTNVWDGTAGGGTAVGVGGMVGVSNQLLVDYPGLAAVSGQPYSRYNYGYGYGYGYPYSYGYPYGSSYSYPYYANYRYGGYGHQVYPSLYSGKAACPTCVVPPPKARGASTVSAPAPSASPAPSVATPEPAKPSSAGATSSSYTSQMSDQEAEAIIASRMIIGG